MNICKIMRNMFSSYRITDEIYIDYENAKSILKQNKQAILLDVRSEQEYREGHLAGSMNIPLHDLERKNEELKCDKQNIIIVYCQSGNRSKKAMKFLKHEGYENVYEIKGRTWRNIKIYYDIIKSIYNKINWEIEAVPKSHFRNRLNSPLICPL